ncbi:ras GTPase-activating-like protein IQGAP1 isoform X2 [Macrobrachium rosenbergii]
MECGISAQEMDEQRQKNVSYQYLCHLEEAKKWIEACINEELPEAGELEEKLRNGVYLAKLGHFFAPDTVPLRRIYDSNLNRYKSLGLTFRHTDNINYFLKALKKIKLPPIFYPETTDVYDKKNMPRLVFCLHALSLFLFRLGIAPQIQNLYGKVNFSDEVMNAMMQELSKYGCQMPQFGKIGGILASELQVDEASLHAAVIAVNDAIEKKDSVELLETLQNPSAHIQNALHENIESYLHCLSDAKMHKKEIAINKSRDEDYIPDAYDELLTQAEIQGHIGEVNVFCLLEKVEEAVKEGNEEDLLLALTSSVLSVKGVCRELSLHYLKVLAKEMDGRHEDAYNQNSFNLSFAPTLLTKTIIQNAVTLVNQEASAQKQLKRCLENLNKSLECGCPSETLAALRELGSRLPPIMDFAAPLYHEEMAANRSYANCNLTLEEVEGGVKLLSAIASISAAIDTHNPAEVWQYLSHPHAHIQGLEEAYIREYITALDEIRRAKLSGEDSCPLLTYLDIQQVVDDVNAKRQEDNDKVRILTAVNASVELGNITDMMNGLKHPALGLKFLCENDSLHYYQLLKLLRSAKKEMLGSDAQELWLEDIQQVVVAVKRHAEESSQTAQILTRLNKALAAGNDSTVLDLLRLPALSYLHISQNHQDIVSLLKKNFKKKIAVTSKCPWVPYTLLDGSKVFLNLNEGTYTWEKPDEFVVAHKSRFLTLSDLEEVVSRVIQKEAHNKQVDQLVVRLQARVRGYLVRQQFQKKREAIIAIQAWWRMVRGRRAYVMYCKALKMWEPYIIVLQRAVRAWLHRRRIKMLSSHFVKHVNKVIMIQRAWRAHKARQELFSLTHQKNPPLSVLRKFIYLLDVSASDLDEELRLQHLKTDMVKTIRNTHQLEARVDELDVKIGLLVHNRITLQDVMPADKENISPNEQELKHRKNKKGNKDTLKGGTVRSQKGLKALKKESREKLICYQHLFYLLQTEPRYLATLIFSIPPGKTTKFIENVIFTLYNYGANDRDNYLLLKLFKTALEEEIRCKVLRLSDIVSGSPPVIKMIVSFIRKGAGHATLRDMLGPMIQKVVDDHTMQINTNPVEIYKTWINHLEMHSGQASGLPYTVDQEQALQYPEVQKRLAQAITTLKEVTLAFCQQITSNRDLIPYAMLYMARVMRSALQRRFPHIPEKEILKVVGNLLYYRYINSAIVAPDAFDIIKVSPDQKLNNAQRRNLASIAKILQFAASKKGFADEASHLTCLNPFIIDCHEKFKAFFRHCCEVEDPEIVYNVNHYSEATLIVKPTIYISVQEICETHQLLLDHEEILAPDSSDHLHVLLSDLGERPSVNSLVGVVDSVTGSGSVTLGRMEVCLALTNKFEVAEAPEEKETKDSNKLFNRTKQLLVDVMQCVDGCTVGELATGPTLSHHEEKYRTIIQKRKEQEHRAKQNQTSLNRSNSFLSETRHSLHEVKTRLSHNLRRLENQALVSRADSYQALLTAIAGDIVNQRQHKVARRMELQRLLVTAKQLDEKEKFYKDQLESYQTYLKTCLANIAARNKNVHECSKAGGEKGRSKQAVKYTAIKLKEKGVLLEIEDLPEIQMKNVLFEIAPLATTGIFHVQVKFMGVPMEFVEIDIQDLLQQQYEGVSVKRMFAKVKVNVNLLLHLLNTKFYSKKK